MRIPYNYAMTRVELKIRLELNTLFLLIELVKFIYFFKNNCTNIPPPLK